MIIARLSTASTRINVSKSQFFAEQIEYLGYWITQKGIQPVGSLFELLWQLHENDMVHGDSCVPNIILHGEKLLWIDLMDATKASFTLKLFDAELLTWSILNVSTEFALSMRCR
jgi:tRNA A-37 threonylcarbamoyl transferase component Bud32